MKTKTAILEDKISSAYTRIESLHDALEVEKDPEARGNLNEQLHAAELDFKELEKEYNELGQTQQ